MFWIFIFALCFGFSFLPYVQLYARFNELIYSYHREPEKVQIALFITKIDLCHQPKDLIKANNFANQKGWNFYMTSSKKNIAVDESFQKLIKNALKRKYGLEGTSEEDEAEAQKQKE